MQVSLSPGGVLGVTNAGPVVPPEPFERLSRPFEDGLTDAQGSGPGLAIAVAIAAGTDGQLISPARGRKDGFRARFATNRIEAG